MALGDAGGALAHLKAIASRWPASNAVWNLHMRAMAAQVCAADGVCRMSMLLVICGAGTEQSTASSITQFSRVHTSIGNVHTGGEGAFSQKTRGGCLDFPSRDMQHLIKKSPTMAS